jgi:glycosyltransferase involved in cell wall biosynthesis
MKRIKNALRAYSHAGEMRRRRPPELAFSDASRARPTVYYLTPDDNTPRGGVRVMYRHVDLLNATGINAKVLHTKPGFRCTWFANASTVASAREVRLTPADLLVVPDYYAPGLDHLPAGARVVMFNQAGYHTFDHIPFAGTAPGAPYTRIKNLVAMVTVSEDSAALLRYTFPQLDIKLARSVIDPRRFHPGEHPGGRRIAYMPRRRHAEREQLLHVMRSRGILDGWELVPIDGRTEDETAELMRSCAIFLSFCEREGFGLPPAEAMASGCYVVGYTGNGGRDYFDPVYCSPVPECDLLAYAMAVEEAIRRYESDPESLAKAGRLASERILGQYHEAGLKADLTTLYGQLLTEWPAERQL